MNIIIFGPNGSGKGTQSTFITEKYKGIAHIESGAIFREHISKGTALGKEAKSYMDKGELVPDEITIPMILETLSSKSKGGWLLDGFPRNTIQAKKLWEALLAANMPLNFIIELTLSRKSARERLLGRRTCTSNASHANNIYIDGIKPIDGKCHVCGSELTARADDADESAVDKRHDIYYDDKTGTLAACLYFKDIAKQNNISYITVNTEEDIDLVRKNLLAHLAS